MRGRTTGTLLALAVLAAFAVAVLALWQDRVAPPTFRPAGAPDARASAGAREGGPDARSAEAPPVARVASGATRSSVDAPAPPAAVPHATLRGVVLEARAPVAVVGAEVSANLGDLVARTTSGADGRFELEVPAAPGVALSVRHPERVDLTRPLPPEELAREVTVRMRRSARLTVSIPGAGSGEAPEVWLVDRRLGETVPAAPDARGAATFADLAPGSYEVFARRPGGPLASEPEVFLDEGDDRRLTLALAAGARIEGVVVRGDTRATVPGCEVRASQELERRSRAGDEDPVARTGADGRFRLEALATGRVRVAAETPWGARVSQELDLSTGPVGEAAPCTLVVAAPARVSGRVTGESGRPVADAAVAWCFSREGHGLLEEAGEETPDPSAAFPGRARTDAQGRFDLGELPADALDVLAWHDLGSTRVTRKLRAGEVVADLELALTTEVSLRGRVVREDDGAPVAGVRVTLTSGTPGRGAEVESDGAGAFVAQLPPGAVRATVAGEFVGWGKGLVAPDGEELTVTVRPASTLAGWVVEGDSGWGVPGARVDLRYGGGAHRVADCDADGRFACEDLFPGEWTVRVRAGTVATYQVTLLSGANEAVYSVSVPLEEPGGEVHGELVLLGTGEPLEAVDLVGARGARARWDGGRFELRGVRAGDLRLVATAPRVETVAFPELRVTPGSRLELGRFETRHTTRVEVRLTGDAPRGERGTRVFLLRDDEPALPGLVVPKRIELEWDRRRSVYAADDVGRYRWTLAVLVAGRTRLRETVRVTGRTELTFDVPPARATRGRGKDR